MCIKFEKVQKAVMGFVKTISVLICSVVAFLHMTARRQFEPRAQSAQLATVAWESGDFPGNRFELVRLFLTF